jgi:hypothetical protein
MPAKYEHMRDALIAQGKPEAEAKSLAARIYNARRKPGQAPVTRYESPLQKILTRK